MIQFKNIIPNTDCGCGCMTEDVFNVSKTKRRNPADLTRESVCRAEHRTLTVWYLRPLSRRMYKTRRKPNIKWTLQKVFLRLTYDRLALLVQWLTTFQSTERRAGFYGYLRLLFVLVCPMVQENNHPPPASSPSSAPCDPSLLPQFAHSLHVTVIHCWVSTAGCADKLANCHGSNPSLRSVGQGHQVIMSSPLTARRFSGRCVL